MAARIVVIGSLNADLVIGVDRFPVPGETVEGRDFSIFSGGKGANQAYAAARLGGQVSMIGQVGNDAYGGWLKENLSSSGVDVSGVSVDKNDSSGVAIIAVDARGQNQIIIAPGANGTFDAERLEQHHALIESAQVVLLQAEIPFETVYRAARIAKRAGATVVLDPAPAGKVAKEILRFVDYLTPNETELLELTGPATDGRLDQKEATERGRELLLSGAKKVIVKMGALGALMISNDAEVFWPSFSVPVVDTTAAGDAFNGALAAALGQYKTDMDAGRFAVAAAACSVKRKGAQASMPSLDEANRLLEMNESLL